MMNFKALKKVKLIYVVLVFIIITCFNVNAKSNSSSLFSSNLIASCYMNLSAIGKNELSISTTVTSPYILDKMTVYIELQRKVGSTWVKQCVWNGSRDNTFQISLDKTFNNASSGQYRFYEVYTAEGRGIKESKSAYSSITTIS